MSDPNIEMIPVTSSMINSIGYDPETETLRVQFHKSGTYELAGVPQAEFDLLVNSASVGKTYGDFFRDRYDTRKL